MDLERDNLPVRTGRPLPLRRRDGSLRDDDPNYPAPYEVRPGRPAHVEPRTVWPRPVPSYDLDDDEPPARRPRREKNAGAALAITANLSSLRHQLTRVFPRYIVAALVVGVVVRVATGSNVATVCAMAIPVIIWCWWMSVWLRQAKAHHRGEGEAPPGAYALYRRGHRR